MSDVRPEPAELPAESINDPDILECLNAPVVQASPIRSPQERLRSPSALTLSLKELSVLLKEATKDCE